MHKTPVPVETELDLVKIAALTKFVATCLKAKSVHYLPMKELALILVLTVSLVELIVSQQKQAGKVESQNREQMIVQLCTAWDDAYIQHDLAALERILAEDYIGIDDDGNVTKKPDEITLTRAGDLVIKSVSRIEPLKVRFHGTAAIETGFSTVRQEYKGADATGQFRFTIVCIQEQGRWQIASWRGTRVKRK